MRIGISLRVVGIALVFSACNGPKGPSTSELAGARPQGVVVGNGLDGTLKTYSNARLGLHFTYPREWTVLEHSEATTVTNSQVAPADAVSVVKFGLLPDLLGEKISTLSDLVETLANAHPNQTWRKTNFSGHSGYWSEEVTPTGRIAKFFIPYDKGQILCIELDAKTKFDGDSVIASIINSMTSDRQRPQINSVYFSSATFRAGSDVILTVNAEDSISGIDVKRMNAYLGDALFPSPEIPHMGYFWPLAGLDTVHPLATAYPFSGTFTQTSATSLQYLFRLPQNAPVGEMGLMHLSVYDRHGNEAAVECGFSLNNRTFECSGLPNGARLPRFSVNPGTDDGYFQDLVPPEFIEARFEKLVVTASDPRQKLFVTARDRSGLYQFAQVVLRSPPSMSGDVQDPRCVAWDPVLHVAEGQDTYYLSGDASKCFDGAKRRTFQLQNLTIYDRVRNRAECVRSGPNPFRSCRLSELQFHLW